MFSTDSYDEYPVKAQERLGRGLSKQFLIDGPSTRKPLDFKSFLQNDQNKEQLCDLLLRVWSSEKAFSRIESCSNPIIIVKGRAYSLTASNNKIAISEIPELYSKQEETDTRIIIYLQYAAKQGFKSAVVRSPDTDIFFIILYYAHMINLTVYLDTGFGKHRKLIDVSAIACSFGEDYCNSLLGIYVYTGEDCTSAFKGKGKVGPIKKLQKNPRFLKTFQNLGVDWNVKPDLYEQLEEFTCLMYGYQREKNLNEVRTIMLTKMVGNDEQINSKSKVNLSLLPPCVDAHRPHVDRVNYRVAQFKRSHIPIFELPKPFDGQGWEKQGDNIEPIWSYGPILQPSLVDILEQTLDENDENADEDITDYDELLSYVDDD